MSESKPGPALAAGFPDRPIATRGPRSSRTREVFAADCLLQVRAAGRQSRGRHDRSGDAAPGQMLIGLCDPLGPPQAPPELPSPRRHAVLDGADPAHHPRPKHGRALVAGHAGRL